MDKAHAKRVAKVRALPVHHATVQHLHAAMALKAHPALKAKAMAAVKVAAVKNNAAIPVLTTVGTAKGVPLRVVLVLRVVAPTVVADMAAVKVTTIANVAMATSCHATSTL